MPIIATIGEASDSLIVSRAFILFTIIDAERKHTHSFFSYSAVFLVSE